MSWKKNFTTAKTIAFILLSGISVALIAVFIDGHILGSGKDLMNEKLFTNEKWLSWHSLLVRIVGPVVSFNVGGSGGIFAPALSAGASVGAWLNGVFGFEGADANVLILCGMVGLLTGVTRTPFTSAILVLEMTDRHNIIFHLMLAALVSNIAALAIDEHSFYDVLKNDYLISSSEVQAEPAEKQLM